MTDETDDDLADYWGELLERADNKTVIRRGAEEILLKGEHHFGRPVLGKIVILPLMAVKEFRYDKPWACISVTDADWFRLGRLPEISDENRESAIFLGFDDVHFESGADWTPFTKGQAEEVWAFVKEHWDNVELLVIHCHAGICRSAAIGKAICDVLDPEQSQFFTDLYHPNPLVYRIMCETSP